ncbi:MAG: peptidoglycan-binding protein, partial [Bacteroidaceae bacterium]|nr:peptidoglycan-binding protein [Bacteroidaceae bacterium]
MATYTMLSNGSSGSEVRKLQQSLVDAGYDVGGVDGIYGSNTESAVRKYQQANGLAVDGIAGDETLGSLYAPKATTTTQN